MKRPSPKLVATWEKKLQDAGVDNIEQADGNLKKWHNHYIMRRFTADTFGERQRYFELAGQWLEHGTFETGFHKLVWAEHAEGYSQVDIARKLKTSVAKVAEAVIVTAKEAGLPYARRKKSTK